MKRSETVKHAPFLCPCCRSALFIRTSREETPCFRSIWYQCSNLVCGATFNGNQTISQQISPSGWERPLMQLPMAPAMERAKALQAMRPKTDQLDLLDSVEATA